MEIDNCIDEDLGVFLFDQHSDEIEQLIKDVGYCLVITIATIIICVLFLH